MCFVYCTAYFVSIAFCAQTLNMNLTSIILLQVRYFVTFN